VSGS
jgi:hypothetical protein